VLVVKMTVLFAIVVAAIGAVAASLDGEWDFFVLFCALALLQAALGGLLVGPRRIVTVRSDLARWTDERSALTGEPSQRIIDRSIAAYRAGLFVSDD
jgi:hypothetical protein